MTQRDHGRSQISIKDPWLFECRGQTFTQKEFGRAERGTSPRALERLLDALYHAYLHRLFGGTSHVLGAGLSGSFAVPPATRPAGPAQESIAILIGPVEDGRKQIVTLIESILSL
jgi:hypothetical protein